MKAWGAEMEVQWVRGLWRIYRGEGPVGKDWPVNSSSSSGEQQEAGERRQRREWRAPGHRRDGGARPEERRGGTGQSPRESELVQVNIQSQT